MGVVHVELDGAEEVLHSVGLNVGLLISQNRTKTCQHVRKRDLHVGPVDEVLVLASDDDLPRDYHLVVLLITKWGPGSNPQIRRIITNSWNQS